MLHCDSASSDANFGSPGSTGNNAASEAFAAEGDYTTDRVINLQPRPKARSWDPGWAVNSNCSRVN
jgi:hypothetical protein